MIVTKEQRSEQAHSQRASLDNHITSHHVPLFRSRSLLGFREGIHPGLSATRSYDDKIKDFEGTRSAPDDACLYSFQSELFGDACFSRSR